MDAQQRDDKIDPTLRRVEVEKDQRDRNGRCDGWQVEDGAQRPLQKPDPMQQQGQNQCKDGLPDHHQHRVANDIAHRDPEIANATWLEKLVPERYIVAESNEDRLAKTQVDLEEAQIKTIDNGCERKNGENNNVRREKQVRGDGLFGLILVLPPSSSRSLLLIPE